MSISRHAGNTYPYTPISALQGFFANFTKLFDGMLINRRVHPANATSIVQLAASGQRLMVWLADYLNMTNGGSDLVQDPSLESNYCYGLPSWTGPGP